MPQPEARFLLDGIQLIIFDKDGTLIDFDRMWGEWVTTLANRLAAITALPIHDPLFQAMGFDRHAGRVLADGRLAITPMAILYTLTIDVLCEAGLTREAATQAVAQAWHVPDPVALAYPLADLPHLFNALQQRNILIAIATTDDRQPTEATLAGLGIAHFVHAMLCADDNVLVKPAPDMILHLCNTLNILPQHCAMVGDSLADLQMGRAAHAGLVVGVLSGVSRRATLEPLADVVLSSVAELIA